MAPKKSSAEKGNGETKAIFFRVCGF